MATTQNISSPLSYEVKSQGQLCLWQWFCFEWVGFVDTDAEWTKSMKTFWSVEMYFRVLELPVRAVDVRNFLPTDKATKGEKMLVNLLKSATKGKI